METNLCYIRHTIKPVQVAALCGQVRLTFARLDNARLTGDLNLADRFEELANAVTEALGTLPGGPAALLDRARSHAHAAQLNGLRQWTDTVLRREYSGTFSAAQPNRHPDAARNKHGSTKSREPARTSAFAEGGVGHASRGVVCLA